MSFAPIIGFNVSMLINMLTILVFFVAIPVMIGVYVYRDAVRRDMNAAIWTIIAILAPFLSGFIIYLIVRGRYTNLKCPNCAAAVTVQYVVCPKCGIKLKPTCPNCGFPTEADWTVCPKCAISLSENRV